MRFWPLGGKGSTKRWQADLRFALTLLLFGIVIFWTLILWLQIDTAPTQDSNGAITMDKWQRAKDILVLFLPLLTTALGYWFGAAGTEEARADASKTHDQMLAVTSVSDEDIVSKAREAHPDAFR